MKELTNAEEQSMQILWRLEKAFVKDIIERYPEPKPAYNTISTIIRILEKKGFVGHIPYGNTHQYYPLICKDEYATEFMNTIVKDYFGNSFKSLVSFFGQKDKITLTDLEEIKKFLTQYQEKEKGND